MTRRGAGGGTGVVDTEGREGGRGGEREEENYVQTGRIHTNVHVHVTCVTMAHTAQIDSC